MNEDVKASWENFLNPKVVRPLFITASIYVTAYEMLKESIVGRIRDFYIEPNEESKNEYSKKVLSRNKSPLYASLDWLKENDVIGDEDIEAFEEVKKCRNDLAHHLFEKISGNDLPDMESHFPAMVDLLNKVEMWWIVNVELATNLDFDDKDINESEIQPGPVLMIRMMIDVALGDDKASTYYYDEFK